MPEIWKPGMVKLFISHRDTHKGKANELARALEPYGLSSFVAHDTIEPMTQWQAEIRKGLETMDIMLAFVTDDFHESPWTNQEIGFALGRDIPVLALKLQQTDPGGFLGHEQALRGSLDAPAESARDVCRLVDGAMGQSRLIGAFVASQSWPEAGERFRRMEKVIERLSDDDVAQIIEGFAANHELYEAVYLINHHQRLRRFLESRTKKSYRINERIISEVSS